MTREIALHCMKSELDCELCEKCPIYEQTGADHCYSDALRYVIDILEQELCEDAVSRKSVNLILGFYQLHKKHLTIDNLLKDISSLPTVIPTSKSSIEILNMIRTEITQSMSCIDNLVEDDDSLVEGLIDAYTGCLKLIDKYRTGVINNE